MFSDNEVNIYPYNNESQYFTIDGITWPYTPNYPYAYPKHSPTSKSFGRLYYNYPKVTNQYYPSMLPFVNHYGSISRSGIIY
jgi:hypothetical protein